ncbi:hypothetical protein H7K13_23630 [Priestia aryabhattai]|uniref:hypothetical protein n=1 Tax=Priestia aryabhattai TaxID=412384 RepID=UPI001C8D095B|nr:hypothetical protein [Priestia aryabhattai]MBY0077922.1 hypothetical protein [Priestia aryabhattai]
MMELSSVLSSVYSDVTNGGIGCNDIGLPDGYAYVDKIENVKNGIHVSAYDCNDRVLVEKEVFSEISALMVLDQVQNMKVEEEPEDEVVYRVYRSDIETMMKDNEIEFSRRAYIAVLDRVQDYLNQSLKEDVSNYVDFIKDEIMKEVEGE